MNPIKQIGRYEIPIGSVVMVERKAGFWPLISPSYKVILASGIVLHLNEAEKQELDKARELHGQTMQVLGMVAAMQRNNHPVQA